MTKFKVRGKVGRDNIGVITEPLDVVKGEAEGVAVGMQLRGWKDVEVLQFDE